MRHENKKFKPSEKLKKRRIAQVKRVAIGVDEPSAERGSPCGEEVGGVERGEI